jgi:hypothetical protein
MSLDIQLLRNRANLDLNLNTFNKDELKTLFIHNYNTKNGISNSSSLNNNHSYQCFRNSSYYLLSRLQLLIWNKINELPDISIQPFNALNDPSKDIYTIIQTFIELMDDDIVNKLITGALPIEKKRTTFLDTRLDTVHTNNNNKYSALGILDSSKNYKPSYLGSSNGSTAGTVISWFVTNIFSNLQFKILSYNDRLNIVTQTMKQLSDNKLTDYILFKINPNENEEIMTEKEFIDNIDNIKQKSFRKLNGKDTHYNLVGVLYDCPKGIAHQITSICYGTNCIDTPPIHNFHDDDKIIKHSLKDNIKIGILWGCNTEMNVQFLLYERVSVIYDLQKQINDFIQSKNLVLPTKVTIHGGNYREKYLKYKKKYLLLKNSIY